MQTEADWRRWAEEANSALAALAGYDARWWSFGPPCHTFQLVVGDPVGVNVAIMLVGTKCVAGPTMWRDQIVRVSCLPTSADGRAVLTWHVTEPSVGFRAEAQNLMWAKNVDVCDPRKWLLWRPPVYDRPDSGAASDGGS
ncbi:MAG TPA: hypothetical protein VLA12_17170 [Planctomycetaceae bacterium]|nr:hypothetical protein [Planctomycetaceae bacterium]